MNVISARSAKIDHFKDEFRNLIIVSASGDVSTTGWTEIRLSPRLYVADPLDGIWDFDLVGNSPSGTVGEIIIPVSAQSVFHTPTWAGGFKGIRVHSETNNIVDMDSRAAIDTVFLQRSLFAHSPLGMWF